MSLWLFATSPTFYWLGPLPRVHPAIWTAAGQGELFAALSFCLTGGRSDLPYAELAARLGQSEPAVRVAVHRLRKRYR